MRPVLLAMCLVLAVMPGVATAQAQTGTPPRRSDAASSGTENPELPPAALPPVTVPAERYEPPTTVPPTPTIPSAPQPTVIPPTLRPGAAFEVHPLLGLFEQYTDNFNRSSVSKKFNFRTAVVPGLTGRLDKGPLSGFLRYSLQSFYDSEPQQFGNFNSVFAQLGWAINPRLKITVADAFTQGDEPAHVDRLGVQQERRNYDRNVASLTTDYTLATVSTEAYANLIDFSSSSSGASTGTPTGVAAASSTHSRIFGARAEVPIAVTNTARLGYEYLISDSSFSTGAPGVSVHGYQLTSSVARQVTDALSIGLSGVYANRTQDRTTIRPEVDFSRWEVDLFNSYTIAQRLSWKGSVGVVSLNGGGDSAPRVTTQTSLAYWLGRVVIGLAVERGVSETFAQGQNFGVVQTTGYSGTLTVPFTPLIKAVASVSRRQNDFTDLGLTTAVSGTRTNEVLAESLVFRFQLRSWLTASLDYGHTDTSASPGTAFSENRVQLSLNGTF